MRKTVTLALLMCLLTALSFATVTINVTSPQSGSQASSPVSVAASAQAGSAITNWQVSADGAVVYNQNTSSTSLNTSVPLTTGWHTLAISAKDQGGSSATVNVSVDVTAVSLPPPPPSSTSTYTQFLNNLDQYVMTTCGNCGNSGASGTTASMGQSYPATPNMDGASRFLWVDAPSGSYANAYFYLKHSNYPDHMPKHLLYDFYFYVASQYVNLPHGLEFGIYMRHSNYRYNGAWQNSYSRSYWRAYDPVAKHWIDTPVPSQKFAVGWHHLHFEYALNGSTHQICRTDIQIDGVDHFINVCTYAPYNSGTNYMSHAFQLDSDNNGDKYGIYYDKVTVGND